MSFRYVITLCIAQVICKATSYELLPQTTILTREHLYVECWSEKSYNFKFVKEGTNDSRTIAECEPDVKACHLVHPSVDKFKYEIHETSLGWSLRIHNISGEVYGKYQCYSDSIRPLPTDTSTVLSKDVLPIPTDNFPIDIRVAVYLLLIWGAYSIIKDILFAYWKQHRGSKKNIVEAKAHLTLGKSKGQGSIPIASLEQKKNNNDETRQLLSGTKIHDSSQSNEEDSWADAACGSKQTSDFRTDTGRTFTVEDGISVIQNEVNPSSTVELEMAFNGVMDSG